MLIYYLLIAVTTIPYHWLFASTVAGLTITKWIGLLSLLWAAFYFPRRRPAGPLPAGPMAAFLAYFGVQVISCLVRGPGISLHADFTKLLSILSLFLVVLIMTDSEEKLHRVLLVLMLSIAFSSNYVIRQFFQFYGVYRDWRGGGAAGDPNFYAAMVVIWMPACLVLLAGASTDKRRMLYLVAAAVSMAGFVLAASRGGMVALAAMIVFLMLRSRYRLRVLLLTAALLVPMLLLMPASPLRRMLNPSHGDTQSSGNRLTLWEAAWKLYKDHPVVGVGTVGFKERLQEYQNPHARLEYMTVHNTYLECAAIWGTAGLAPLLLHGILLFRALGKVGRRRPATPLVRLATALQAGLLAYAVAAMFLSTWWFMMYWFLVFLSFALIRLAGMEPPAAAPDEHPRRKAMQLVYGRPALHGADHGGGRIGG